MRERFGKGMATAIAVPVDLPTRPSLLIKTSGIDLNVKELGRF